MIKSFLSVAWRNLLKNKGYSFINIGGLAVGMGVAIIIALWIYDELTFDKYYDNYDRIAQVMQNQTWNGQIGTQEANPAVMAEEIRSLYGNDFAHVLQASWNHNHTITYGEKMFLKPGSFFEPGVTDMLSLKMVHGSRDGLNEMNSIMMAESVAKTYFDDENPIGKVVRLNDKVDLKVTGVYEDFPHNTSFSDMQIIMPWSLYLNQNEWVRQMDDSWDSNFTRTFAMIDESSGMAEISLKIKDVKLNKVSADDRRYNPQMFLHPMSKWHLYSDFKNGVNTGGKIDVVWLFLTIGLFVLILACINFMNLSTARSEKRAKEVGIRKAVGSQRKQLVYQFFSESMLTALMAFVISLLLVYIMLPSFNIIADKKISLPLDSPLFWTAGVGFSVATGMFAGFYPALFLSSFQPVKVLKGTFRVGRYASLPRKILVVTQFMISITLIIGTIVVYKQIDHAQNRPIGYDKDGLISIPVTKTIHDHFDAVRTELINARAIVEMAESGSPTTAVWNTNGGFDWEGKDPDQGVDFPNNAVSVDYGKTIGWEVIHGRDFSREFASDSAAFILNEAAVEFIGFKDNPVGKIIHWNDQPFTVIGVVKDLLVQSPYQPVRAAMWHLTPEMANVFLIRIHPEATAKYAVEKVEEVFKRVNPASPVDISFVDEEYARKFGNEKRIGQLATIFATLAIFISCLGLFGLASFVAEQRTKEIGIRKVLGASIPGLWRMLSQDFVVLVVISSILSTPIAYYFITDWLKQFEYRTDASWWVFTVAVLGAVTITLLTVSYQAFKASMMNPVTSLRNE
jgi:ABC-type antimicrobial peptide transport system permease subunit